MTLVAFSDTFWGVVTGAPLAFVLGLLVGFVLSSRYRVIRVERKAKEGE